MNLHPKFDRTNGTKITPEVILNNATLWAKDLRVTTEIIDDHFSWAIRYHRRNALSMGYWLEVLGLPYKPVKPTTKTFERYVRKCKVDPSSSISDRLDLIKRICEAAIEMDEIWKSERNRMA